VASDGVASDEQHQHHFRGTAAVHSISIKELGTTNAATATVERAGGSVGKNSW
jgi:hypothetical protein